MWSDGIAQTYWTSPTPTRDAKANAAAYKAREHAIDIHRTLFPED